MLNEHCYGKKIGKEHHECQEGALGIFDGRRSQREPYRCVGQDTSGREDRKCKGSRKGGVLGIQEKIATGPLRLDVGE